METNIIKINVGGTLLPVNDPNVCDNFEDGNTASKTYNAGEFLIWKGSLYKVTTTIAQGATFTDGVNLEDATIAELLEAVNTSLSDVNKNVFSDSTSGTTPITINQDLLSSNHLFTILVTVSDGTTEHRQSLVIKGNDLKSNGTRNNIFRVGGYISSSYYDCVEIMMTTGNQLSVHGCIIDGNDLKANASMYVMARRFQ